MPDAVSSVNHLPDHPLNRRLAVMQPDNCLPSGFDHLANACILDACIPNHNSALFSSVIVEHPLYQAPRKNANLLFIFNMLISISAAAKAITTPCREQ